MGSLKYLRAATLFSSALGAIALSGVAYAQDAEGGESSGLQEIIVTAQKREQSVQDVPIAVTALTEDALVANRVTNVTDLSGLAPGVTVRTSSGGSKLPSFTVRGAVSYGVVPGSDKQVSIYLDGVYISSPRGSIFELPDVQRIEMLRGPQGTLFGRNATAGAVSIATRDPTGEVGIKASATYGNMDQTRFMGSVDLPQMGPFSAYLSFVHNYKRGDIRNDGAGQVWDRTNSVDSRSARVLPSPRWLGTKDAMSYFAALKFESGDFTTVYKFDKTEDDGTPEGTGFIGYGANVPLIGTLLDTLITTQPTPVLMASDGKRPKAVSNSWTVPTTQDVEGHSLTSTWQASDSLSFKNVFGYRKSYLFTASSLDGFSALTITPESIQPLATLIAFSTLPPDQAAAAIPGLMAQLGPLVGSPYLGLASQPENRSEQISNELQLNYNSDFVTATAGLLWFQGKDWTGEGLLQNTVSFSPIPFGVLPNANIGRSFNKAESIAAYAQLEFHVTPDLDIVAGGRVTRDKKSGSFAYGPTPAALTERVFEYKKTKPNYLIGVNYRPADDMLLYAKYSTGFVSGGSVAGLAFKPETVESIEGGVKADFWDNKVRTSLALFHAKYKHVQSAQGAANFTQEIIDITGDPNLPASIGTFVADQGTVKATGFEAELTAAPTVGLMLGGSLSYTDTKFSDVNPILLSSNGGRFIPTFRPDWTAGLWAQYDTAPINSSGAYFTLRADATWQSDMNLAQNPDLEFYRTIGRSIEEVPAYWLLNGRVALRDFDLGGIKTELGIWGRNLTDEKAVAFALGILQPPLLASANYIPARTYGVDLTIQF